MKTRWRSVDCMDGIEIKSLDGVWEIHFAFEVGIWEVWRNNSLWADTDSFEQAIQEVEGVLLEEEANERERSL